MVWIRIDDQIAHHPKFIEAGPVAAWLWVCGNGYCNKYLTDGFIPSSALSTLGVVNDAQKHAQKLVDATLWDVVDGGYQVHDFFDYNPRSRDVKAKRRRDRNRKRKERIRANKRPRSVRADNQRDSARSPRDETHPAAPVPDPDPGPASTKNPPTPLTGGRLTRAERKTAERIRGLWFGCRHEPRCSSYEACLLEIVLAQRERTAAS